MPTTPVTSGDVANVHTAAGKKGRSNSGGLERVTVNLIPKASRALEDVVQLTGDSKTDAINRALQISAYIERTIAEGGAIYVREGEDGELVRVTLV